MMSEGVVTVSYIMATILFILALGGLSNQETARRGNWYGIIGMTIALLATIASDKVTGNFAYLIVALLVGGSIGLMLARRVQMTQMPELVAVLHSLVGMAAVAVGFASFMDPTSTLSVSSLRFMTSKPTSVFSSARSRFQGLLLHSGSCRDASAASH